MMEALDSPNCDGASSSFMNTVYNNAQDFEAVNTLACQRNSLRECYSDIQTSISNCELNPNDEFCMDYATCECLDYFLSMVDVDLSPEFKTTYLHIGDDVMERMRIAQDGCYCGDLNYEAVSLEYGSSCAVASVIVERGDVLAVENKGSSSVIVDTCGVWRNNNNSGSGGGGITHSQCAMDVQEVREGIIERGCEYRAANAKFVSTVSLGMDDFTAIESFICKDEGGCYAEVKSAVELCANGATEECVDSTACGCLEEFLAMVGGFSEDIKLDLLSIEDKTLAYMTEAVGMRPCGGIATTTELDLTTNATTTPATTFATESNTSSPMVTEAPKATSTEATSTTSATKATSPPSGLNDTSTFPTESLASSQITTTEATYTTTASNEALSMSSSTSSPEVISACKQLYSQAMVLKNGDTCSLANSFMQAQDIFFSGGPSELQEYCTGNAYLKCIDGAQEVLTQIEEEGCVVGNESVENFMYSIVSDDFLSVARFSCSGCYDEVKIVIETTCGSASDSLSDEECTKSASCECLSEFLSVVSSLSEAIKTSLIRRGGYVDSVAAVRGGFQNNMCVAGGDIVLDESNAAEPIASSGCGGSRMRAVFIGGFAVAFHMVVGLSGTTAL